MSAAGLLFLSTRASEHLFRLPQGNSERQPGQGERHPQTWFNNERQNRARSLAMHDVWAAGHVTGIATQAHSSRRLGLGIIRARQVVGIACGGRGSSPL